MIRSLRGGAALVVLALASLTWGQSGSPPGSSGRAYTISVQEPGKPSQVCKILKVWTEADGLRGYQVEALDTGERMTVMETAPPPTGTPTTAARTVSTRVYRYGKSLTPPPGTPAPPANAMSLDGIAPSPTASPYSAAAAPAPVPGKTTTTLKPTAPVPTPTPTVTQAPTPAPRIAPVPQPQPQPVVAQPTVTTPTVTTPAVGPYQAALPPAATTPALTEKTADWRQSWGRLDQIKVEEQAPRIAGADQMKVATEQAQRGMERMPVARKETIDPLKQPAVYSKTPTKTEPGLGMPLDTPARLAATTPATTGAKTTLVSTPPTPTPTPVKTAPVVTAPAPTTTTVTTQKPVAPTPYTPPTVSAQKPPTPAPTAPTPMTPVKPTPTATPTTTALGAVGAGCAVCTPCNQCNTCPTPTGPLRPVAVTPPTPAPTNTPTVCQPCVTPTTPAPATMARLSPTPTPAPPLAPVVDKPKPTTPALVPVPVAVPVVEQPKKLTPTPAPTLAPVTEQPKKLTPTPAPPPAPVVEQPKKAPSPTPVVATPRPTEPTKTASTGSWNPFARPGPARGMASVAAAGSRELQDEPQPVVVDRPMGGALSVTPPGNAFADPIVKPQLVDGNAFTQPPGYQPIPMDRVRKDLMPPELVALLEGKGRSGKPLPAGMEPPLPFTPPQQAQVMAPMPPQPVILPPRPTGIQPVAVNPALEQHRQVLREGLLPSDREIAADHLANFEPSRAPLAISSLLAGATTDPAITVRVACIRGLGRMRAGTPEVLTALTALQQDPDQRIRVAAVEVRALLQPR